MPVRNIQGQYHRTSQCQKNVTPKPLAQSFTRRYQHQRPIPWLGGQIWLRMCKFRHLPALKCILCAFCCTCEQEHASNTQNQTQIQTQHATRQHGNGPFVLCCCISHITQLPVLETDHAAEDRSSMLVSSHCYSNTGAPSKLTSQTPLEKRVIHPAIFMMLLLYMCWCGGRCCWLRGGLPVC